MAAQEIVKDTAGRIARCLDACIKGGEYAENEDQEAVAVYYRLFRGDADKSFRGLSAVAEDARKQWVLDMLLEMLAELALTQTPKPGN